MPATILSLGNEINNAFTELMRATINKCLLGGTVIISMFYGLSSLKSKRKDAFSSVLNVVCGFVALHAAYMWIMAAFYPGKHLLNPPFALMYGPFLYFGFTLIHQKTITVRRIALHVNLFVFFTLCYALLFTFGLTDLAFFYQQALALASIFSFLCYSVQAMVSNAKSIDARFRQHKLLLIAIMVIMLFATIVLCTGIFNEMMGNRLVSESLPLKMTLHACLLSSLLLIFFFQRFSQTDITISDTEIDGKYKNSILPEEKLLIYQTRLEMLMRQEQVYLDTELSLLKLAQLMRAPSHHITQVLNAQIKMSFYEYINSFRVQTACRLLIEHQDNTLEIIAVRSGFKSKVSFNRHFKLSMGCTPSEYRQVHHKGD